MRKEEQVMLRYCNDYFITHIQFKKLEKLIFKRHIAFLDLPMIYVFLDGFFGFFMKYLMMDKLLVKVSSLPGIKKIVHAKFKILLSFTHPHIVFFSYIFFN